MSVTRVSPEEARRLVDEQGYVYVDVRSVREFATGHPTGAYNIPLVDAGPMGMAPNARFLAAMEATFAKDAHLVLGCQSGGRSLHAAHVLAGAGFTDLVEQRAGFGGTMLEAGWKALGLPMAEQAEAGRSWAEIAAKVGA